MSQEEKFAEVVATRIAEAERRLGLPFMKLHNLVIEKGSYVAAARHLLSPRSSGKFSYGFRRLAAADLLSLSIEHAALEFEHAGLFTEEQLSNARARLALGSMLAARLNATDEARVTNAIDDSGAGHEL